MGRRILSSTSGNLAARSIFPWPASVSRPAAIGDNTGSSAGYLPIGWLTDGSALQCYSLNGFALINAAGVPIWTKLLADFPNATALVRESIYLDAVDQAAWFLSYNGNTTPATMYLNKLVIATGALTVVGSFSAQATNALASNQHLLTRTVEGVGNLQLFSTSTVNGGVYKSVLNYTTGAMVSGPTAIVAGNGVALAYAGSGLAYVSADESLIVAAGAGVLMGSTATDKVMLSLSKNGRQATIQTSQDGFPLSMITNATTVLLRHIGGGRFTTFHPIGGQRLTGGVYTRAALDAWLNQVATLAGL
ncbi:hypothetical protein FNU76_23870 [Chitinimonas arctica]|uniref:Uncharacterized protein n=1 Tax=Chitinimonas arctica TaxID=2594795 RepID=A0A516SLW3_9NEIS|nr:hypothetical protein [Chitinimonas arctica]QDQ29143.1 hypothetical protein FNU76_23870 [Chitinimonas arctica]